MSLDNLARIFESCIREAGVFERHASGAGLIEIEVIRDRRNVDWVVIAAGIDQRDAASLFAVTSKRADRATVQLTVLGGGRASLLFVVRPWFPVVGDLEIPTFVCPFCPARRIPHVALREGYFRLWDLEKENGPHSLRWEFTGAERVKTPMESWLAGWHTAVGFNPAHAPSHVHFNSPEAGYGVDQRDRTAATAGELRLAVGLPNPIALILSVAAWLRS